MINTLIIDDDNPSVLVLTERLKAFSDVQIVATAHNGEGGRNAVMKYKPDLLFLDIELPDISGLDFLSSLDKNIDWDMKVVFYTSYEKYLLQALRLQAFDFLLKKSMLKFNRSNKRPSNAISNEDEVSHFKS